MYRILRAVPYLLVWGVAIILLAGCGPSRLELDSEQGRLDEAAPIIEGSTTVGQTFVSHRDRLAAVEVLLVVYGERGATDGKLTFHLRTHPTSARDLATRTFRTGELIHNQALRITFDPLSHSSGQSYYFFFEGTTGSQVTLWYNTVSAYEHGAALFNGQSRAGDLQFKTFYDYSLAMVARDVMRGIVRYGWLALPLAGLLLLPGYLMLLLGVPAKEMPDPMLQIALAVGLSVGVLPLGLLLTTLMGLSLTPLMFATLLGMVVLAVLWRLWSLQWRPLTPWRDHSSWPTLGVFVGLLILTLGLRMLQIRELVVPPWVDGVHHTMMAKLIAEQGRVPSDYQPYLGVGAFTYHFGFHTLAAEAAWLTGLSVPRAVLIVGQVVNALVGVGVYAFTATLLGGERSPATGRRPDVIAGLVAMGVVGTISLMPAYYVTWGRYTQLAGLVVLPAAAILTMWWLENGKRWALILGGVAVAGLALVHYRVLVFYAAFVAALVVYRVTADLWGEVRNRSAVAFSALWQIQHSASALEAQSLRRTQATVLDYILRGMAVASLSLLLLSPWIARLVLALVPTGRGAGWFRGQPAANAVPYGLIDVGYDRILLRLALLSVLLGLVWWRRTSILIGLSAAGAVLAANPNLLGLHETWLLNNTALVITLFLPMAILIGVLIGVVAEAILQWIGGRWRLVVTALMAGLFAAVVLAGTWEMLDIVNPVTIIATEDDMAAMRWIRENTASDAGFVTNVRIWQFNTYMGADGGYWIPFLTDRRTLVPPAIYSFGSQAYYRQVQDVLETLASISGATDQKLTALMRRHDLEYVYLGARGGPLDLKSFLGDPSYEVVYSNGPVWIFRAKDTALLLDTHIGPISDVFRTPSAHNLPVGPHDQIFGASEYTREDAKGAWSALLTTPLLR